MDGGTQLEGNSKMEVWGTQKHFLQLKLTDTSVFPLGGLLGRFFANNKKYSELLAMDDHPPLVGVNTPAKTPGKIIGGKSSTSARKEKGKRISELQTRFESTGDTSVVDEKEVKRAPVKRGVCFLVF